jgi:hypothetical protein
MGSGAEYSPGTLSSLARSYLGVHDAGESRAVALAAGENRLTTDVLIRPQESLEGLRAIVVTDPATGDELWITYQSENPWPDASMSGGWGLLGDVDSQPQDLGVDWETTPGMVVMRDQPRVRGSNNTPHSTVASGTLHSVDGRYFWRAGFRAGETFVSRSGAVSATVLSMSPDAGLSVRVNVNRP